MSSWFAPSSARGAETRRFHTTWVSALRFVVAAVLFVVGVRTLAEVAHLGAVMDQFRLRHWLRQVVGR